MEVLYFDNHIVAVNKEAGIPTQSEEGDSLEAQVKIWAKKEYQKKGEVFLKAVHRLDKPASGVVLLAKTSKALVRLQEAFKQRSVRKKYFAWVQGEVHPQTAVLEDFLLHGQHRAEIGDPACPEAKVARLSYVVRERRQNRTLLEIDLHTGRYHQIRIQLSSRGYPILNDVRYGALNCMEGDKIALHQYELEVQHPVSGQQLKFRAEVPATWVF